MMNPEDVAAARYKEIAKAREQLAKVEAAVTRSQERSEELRARLNVAVGRDREKLAAALVDSKPEPPPEAAKVKAELEREGERAEALGIAAAAARSEIPKVVAENRAGWLRRAEQEIGKASGRYQKAIVELQAAREALDDEATLFAWLRTGAMSNAATDSLGGRTNLDASGRAVISFTRTLEGLREDVEHLVAHASPDGNPTQGEPRLELAWTAKG